MPPSCVARYDAYGNPDGNTVTAPAGDCASGNTINSIFYRGQRRDYGSGNYQLGSRTYDTSKASFLTPHLPHRRQQPNASIGTDPLTRNTYSYVNGDPIKLDRPHRTQPHRGNGSQRRRRRRATGT